MDERVLAYTGEHAVVPISRYVIWEFDEERHLTERLDALGKILRSQSLAVDRRKVAVALMNTMTTICNRQFALFNASEVMYGT